MHKLKKDISLKGIVVNNSLLQWVLAGMLAFAIVNGIAFLYNYDPEWVKRSGGMTEGLYVPGSRVIINEEGNGYGIVDKNGYMNYSACLDKDYILVFGNSQSNGYNVHYSDTYIYRLNTMLGFSDSLSCVYNVSNGGYTICDIIKGFKAGIMEFPHSSGVVIQINSTDFDLRTMENALKQREYSDEDSIDYVLKHRTLENRIQGKIKKYFPFLTIVVGERFPKWDKGLENAFFTHQQQDYIKENYNREEYRELLSESFGKIRKEYNGKLMVLYLPSISIENSGMVINYDISFSDFSDICSRYDIEVIDMGGVYLRNYNLDYRVPYGFDNTSPGSGHLNESGHEMVAQTLYKIIGQVNRK